MPIKFRCPHCRQFLGISRGKAGALTDCPTCGRTIRIPELDGKVMPLPKPELNLGDSELAGALDALARLDAAREAPAREEPAGGESAEPRPRVVAIQAEEIREMGPAPAAIPVAIEPALPAEPAASRGGAASTSAAATVDPPADPLDELIRLNPGSAVGKGAQRRPGSKGSTVLLIVSGVMLFGIGVLTGRLTAPVPGEATAAVDAERDGSPEPANPTPVESIPPEPVVELVPALSGRLTYATDGGVQPDLGARVIVLPKEREGTARLPVVGFRAGAAPADQMLGRTSLRALGGDFTTADDQGRYTVRLAGAGEYRVLFLSRFQPRDEAGFLEPSLQEALASYFDRPAALIGPVAYEFAEFTFRGEEAAPLDHVFQEE